MTVNTSVPTTAHAAVVGYIPPRSHGPGASSCTWVNMSTFGAIQAVVSTGLLSVGATVNAKLEQAQDAAGTGAKDIPGKAITPLDDEDDNVQAAINCRAADLDVNGGFTHARLTVTTAVADANTAALVLGFSPRYGTAADNAAASLVEIVP